ncbi:hypothetical protein MT1821.1 [Mycobacterium tuberculosis CDC1551]|uniref:Uncharacterized protein n=1 Tax=Mycobacterium tuberculosis (strain CDC 1551 / Oshkosh) TaxID=83331 RepID=Q8VJW9_MYCTO|nr:hypothetical protein MT1821.1 [Mycobacterium tuberculosis CDC1551]
MPLSGVVQLVERGLCGAPPKSDEDTPGGVENAARVRAARDCSGPSIRRHGLATSC